MKVTAEAARRFLVQRHLLAPERSLEDGPDAVLEVFHRLGSIQFDPLAVAGRNHDLVLHALVAGYDPAWSDLLYERREVFEAYNKGLSLVPTSEYHWFRATVFREQPRVLAENACATGGSRCSTGRLDGTRKSSLRGPILVGYRPSPHRSGRAPAL